VLQYSSTGMRVLPCVYSSADSDSTELLAVKDAGANIACSARLRGRDRDAKYCHLSLRSPPGLNRAPMRFLSPSPATQRGRLHGGSVPVTTHRPGRRAPPNNAATMDRSSPIYATPNPTSSSRSFRPSDADLVLCSPARARAIHWI
jgi:hypothetical protein